MQLAQREGADQLMRRPPGVSVLAGDRDAPLRSSTPLSSPQLIGRDDEVDLLVHVLRRPPALAVLDGEAGIGKTRIVADLLGSPRLADRRRLVGRCHELREPFPLGPIVEAIRGVEGAPLGARLPAIAGALRPLLPELAAELPPLPDTSGDSRLDRHILFRALLGVLSALGPTLLVLEDMHWADETTVEFLRFLVRQIPTTLGLIVTYRRENLRRGSRLLGLTSAADTEVATTDIHLAPLGHSEVRELVRAILSADDVSDEFTAYLQQRTSGIPFAIEEVLRLVQDRHDLTRRDGVWVRRSLTELGVPPVIRDAVLQRVEELSRDAQRVVEAAAVIGVPVSEEVLLAVAAATPEALSETLTTAVVCEVESHRYSLRHALATQAVAQAIPRPDRRLLHLRAARVLEEHEPGNVGLLALHYREAGAVLEWARNAELAAEVAVGMRDAAGAAAFLREVVTAPGVAPEDRARLATKLARAALSSVTPPDSTSELLQHLVMDEDLPPGDRAELRALLGLLYVSAGDASAGYRTMAEAVPDLQDKPEAVASVMINLAAPWVVEGHATDHLRWLEQAEAVAQRGMQPSAQLGVALARALVPLYLGDPAGWDRLADIPWEATGEAGQLLWASSNLVGACFHLGHYARARAFLEDACHRAEALGWGPFLHVSESAALLLDWASGGWTGLEERARRQATELADFPGWSVNGQLVEGSLLLSRGDLDRAERVLREAFDSARAAGIIPGLETAATRLARICLERGEPEQAVAEAMRGLEIVEAKGVWVWAAGVAPPAVEALLRCGRRDEAGQLVRRFAAGLRDRDAPTAEAARIVCEGILLEGDGNDRAAARTYGVAEQLLRSLPQPYDAERLALNRGRCLLRGGDAAEKDDGATLVNSALAFFDELGASIDSSRARRFLREFDIPIRKAWRGGRRGYGSSLSPREEEIAAYVERGLTNVEIAATVCLSARTVEHHLSAAMQKKGVRTRAQLAAAMREERE